MSIKEILNNILQNLSSAIDDVEFSLYFPSRKFSVPLKEKYNATIGVKSKSINPNSNYNTNVFHIELLSPVDKDGVNILSKAVEISSALLDMNISAVQSCVIGDIEYISSQRSFKTTITFTAEKQLDDDTHIMIADNKYSCIIVNEKSLFTACDIKVYGQSKPIDTVLSTYEYMLTVRMNNSLELPQKGFEVKKSKYKYLNCFIQSVEINGKSSEYKIVSKERVLI
ncbi:MAG: hypothetical protein UHY68_08655 [Acutalibacteraceae bacterium]|nr:hypothetical protein [Acutalibacteraceae bacterium]